MRVSLFILTAVYVAFGAVSARAEELASAPGWSLNRIVQEKADNDFSYGESRVFFALKPPDQRPAVTIDSRAADRLRSGEATAESLYGGQAARPSQNKDEEFVYGNKSNGLVVAEPVLSTLTTADGRRDVAVEAPEEAGSRSSSSSSSGLSSLGGLSSGSSSSSRSFAGPSEAPPSRNTSAASAPPPVAGPPAGGGDRAVVDSRVIASEQAKILAPVTPATTTGMNASNEAGGFAIKKKDKDGKESKEKDKEFIVWPGGVEPGTAGAKPVCQRSAILELDKAGTHRFSAPVGCNHIKVKVWGAGGGQGILIKEGEELPLYGSCGNFVYTEGDFDGSKYEIVVVVGEPGGNAAQKAGGALGYPGGRAGRDGDSGGGGGGGGFSGVFLSEKGKESKDAIEIDTAIAAASAGWGGGYSAPLVLGGAGGHLGGEEDRPEGHDFYRFLDKFKVEPSSQTNGSKPGNFNDKSRGKAGEVGQPGKVIVEFF